MGFFSRKKKEPSVEQAVITHLPLSGGEFGSSDEMEDVHELEDRIIAAVKRIGGEHDGDEFGDGEVSLYTYGPDADALLAAIRESFGDFPVRPGAYAIKRYGPAGDADAREERVELA